MHRVLWPFRHPRLILILLVVAVSVAVPVTHKPKTASASTYNQYVKSGDDSCSGSICGMMSDLLSVPGPTPCPVHATQACANQKAGAYDGSYFGTRKNANGTLKNTCWTDGSGNCVNFSSGPWDPRYQYSTTAKWLDLDSSWMGHPADWNRSGWQRPTWNGYNNNIGAAYICSGTGAPNGCPNNDDYCWNINTGVYDGNCVSPKKGIKYNREFYLDHPRWQIDSVDFRYQAGEWAGAIVDSGYYFPACDSGQLEAGFSMSYDNSTNGSQFLNWVGAYGCGGNNPGIYGNSGGQLLARMQGYDGESLSPPQHDYIAMEAINRFNNTNHPSIAYNLHIQYKEPNCNPYSYRVKAGKPITITGTGPYYAQYQVIDSAGGAVTSVSSNAAGNFSVTIQFASAGPKDIIIRQRSSLDSRTNDYTDFGNFNYTDGHHVYGNNCHVTVTPPPSASCNALPGGLYEAEVPFNVSPSIHFTYFDSAPTSPAYRMPVQVVNAGGGVVYNNADQPYSDSGVTTSTYNGVTDSAFGVDGTAQATVSVPALSAGTYTVNWGFVGGSINLSCPPTHMKVYSLPYFGVYNGDVRAGATFDTDNNTAVNLAKCTAPVSSYKGVAAFNKGSGGNYAGSGADVATIATNRVYEFVSANKRAAPAPPKGLTFANFNNISGDSEYGGGFSSAPCTVGNYWSLSKYGTVHSGLYIIDGSNAPSFSSGAHDIFVDGNVYIKSSISYTGSPWSVGNIPYFRLIVHGGNIYIDPSVTQLDGLYIAIPNNSSTGGTIYTCSTGAAKPSTADVAGVCGSNQLTVNGTFIANQVKLLRTKGTLHNASAGEGRANASTAEKFIYTPELWLGTPETSSTEGYDAITSLPPIL